MTSRTRARCRGRGRSGPFWATQRVRAIQKHCFSVALHRCRQGALGYLVLRLVHRGTGAGRGNKSGLINEGYRTCLTPNTRGAFGLILADKAPPAMLPRMIIPAALAHVLDASALLADTRMRR